MTKYRGFLLLGTFATVYCIAPWLAQKIFTLVNPSVMEHPERYGGVGLWVMITTYYILRRIWGEKVPRV
ncbi:MAG: hypothetical protein C4294_17825 [Nitrospiraceae bacterium]